jgi:hypothetical protein
MRWGILLLVAAALVLPVLNYRLYTMPDQLKQLDVETAPLVPDDANVYLIVSSCGRYLNRSGFWWWKRMEVDYRACSNDPSTVEGTPVIIGQFRQPGAARKIRVQSTWACLLCKGDWHIIAVEIPLGTRPEETAKMRIPVDIHLSPQEELQILFGAQVEVRYPGSPEATFPLPALFVR